MLVVDYGHLVGLLSCRIVIDPMYAGYRILDGMEEKKRFPGKQMHDKN